MGVVDPVLDGLISVIFFVKENVDDVKEKEATMKANIGTRVKLDGKKLTVVNYSLIDNTYTLSNNVAIKEELYKKLKIKSD
jgi:hypothetical protein